MTGINFQRTYQLNDAYKSTRESANQVLHKYLGHPSLITFNDSARSVTFSSEKLIPKVTTDRPRILLLFSNPHPYSIIQGMFLSPNTKGKENLFWQVMDDAGWITGLGHNLDPKQLADICLNVKYQGPFELFFYCYYAFPTPYPEDICKIFGTEFFCKKIETEAIKEFREMIQETSVQAVVTFNKGIFNLVTNCQIKSYVERLVEGELIQGEISGLDRLVPVFLTFPTGWRYRKQYMQFRKASLDAIRTEICRKSIE